MSLPLDLSGNREMADSNSSETIPLNDFQNDYFKTLNDFREKNMFCDVTLNVNGRHFPCHRLVLTTASTYFQTMFNGSFKESQQNTIDIEQIEGEVMEQILNAIYTAQIRLTSENAVSILKASHFLQLNRLFDTCVSYIVKNPSIHYLIDACLFAKAIEKDNLYDACALAIANNLLCLAKTNIFEEIPSEVLRSILISGNFAKKEDEVLMLIVKWIKANKCTRTEIQKLLEVARFQSPIVMAAVLSKVDVTFMFDEPFNESGLPAECGEGSNPNFGFNLYVKAIDVKTGAMGCSWLKLNESFKHATLSDFHATSSFSVKICKLGRNIYCFEFNKYTKMHNFWTYVNNVKIYLPVIKNSAFRGEFEIVPMDNSILFLSRNPHLPDIWVYNCEEKTWRTTFNQAGRPIRSALHDFSDWYTATALDGILYVIGGRENEYTSRHILAFNRAYPTIRSVINFPDPFGYEYVSVCTFDGKIAVSGTNYSGVRHNAFYIYHVGLDDWLQDIKPMKNVRKNHKLIYGNDFIYAVGNNPLTVNEKYNVRLNMWLDHPPFPTRLSVENTADQVVAIDDILYAEAYPAVKLSLYGLIDLNAPATFSSDDSD